MLVNLTDVLTNEGRTQELSASYEADSYTCQLGTFPIKEKSPIVLKLSNAGQAKAEVEGSARIVLVMQCDRCLSDVDYTFDLSFSRRVAAPDYVGDDIDSDDMDFMEGYHLDIDGLVNNEILLNWPMKVLCSESCKGICKVCGKNLNEGDCGCDDFVPDPRMAAIKDIFNAYKEV